MTPRRLSEQATLRLHALGNPAIAQRAKRFFKPHEKIAAYGVSLAQLQKLTAVIFAEIKREWNLPAAIEFCELQLTSDFMEGKHLGIFLLARFRKHFTSVLLKSTHKWLNANLCANWAATDALCSMVIAPLLKAHPELASNLLKWGRSKNLWVRRASAVALASLARHGEHLHLSYEIAEQLFGDKEDLIHKATGWLLREAGKTDAARLEKFLLRHGPQIPRTALRYAIERFPERKRKGILNQTKTHN
jgi:3-methyladenine DNA glycosylase AlkD